MLDRLAVDCEGTYNLAIVLGGPVGGRDCFGLGFHWKSSVDAKREICVKTPSIFVRWQEIIIDTSSMIL